ATAVGWGLWVRWPSRMPDPPVPDLASAEPDVADAIEAARAPAAANPRSAAAWGHLGMVLHVHDYLPEAERCYAQAGKLDSIDPRWPYLEGLTQLHDPVNFGAGLGSLERAVELSGDLPAPRLRLGEALLEQGRLDEAERHFRHVLEREPTNAR